MDYVIAGLSLVAGLHALTFSRWLKHNGNKIGAYGVYIIILIGLALPVYRFITEN